MQHNFKSMSDKFRHYSTSVSWYLGLHVTSRNSKTLLKMFSSLPWVVKITLHYAFEYCIAEGRRQKRKKRNS